MYSYVEIRLSPALYSLTNADSWPKTPFIYSNLNIFKCENMGECLFIEQCNSVIILPLKVTTSDHFVFLYFTETGSKNTFFYLQSVLRRRENWKTSSNECCLPIWAVYIWPYIHFFCLLTYLHTCLLPKMYANNFFTV